MSPWVWNPAENEGGGGVLKTDSQRSMRRGKDCPRKHPQRRAPPPSPRNPANRNKTLVPSEMRCKTAHHARPAQEPVGGLASFPPPPGPSGQVRIASSPLPRPIFGVDLAHCSAPSPPVASRRLIPSHLFLLLLRPKHERPVPFLPPGVQKLTLQQLSSDPVGCSDTGPASGRQGAAEREEIKDQQFGRGTVAAAGPRQCVYAVDYVVE